MTRNVPALTEVVPVKFEVSPIWTVPAPVFVMVLVPVPVPVPVMATFWKRKPSASAFNTSVPLASVVNAILPPCVSLLPSVSMVPLLPAAMRISVASVMLCGPNSELYACSFPAVGPLPWQMLGRVVENAGVHRYLDSGDNVIANAGWVGVHAASAGLKRLHLPHGKQATEVFSGRNIGKPADGVLTLQMQRGESLLFALEDANTGSGEIQQTNPLKAWIQNGLLHITGITPGETLNVYTVTGAPVYHGIAASSEANVQLSVQGVYIVCSGNNMIKVSFN